MCPRQPDPALRLGLIEAAARLLVDDGPQALTTRRLADEVGASTSAVYTHFAGMTELRRALAREGFARLARHLDGIPVPDDPITEVGLLGAAFYRNGISNPHLYQLTFREHPEPPPGGAETFLRLGDAVARAIDAGRVRGDGSALTRQLWIAAHGVTSLSIAGLLESGEALRDLTDMATHLFVGFGDTRGRGPALAANSPRLRAGARRPPLDAVCA